MKRQELLLEIEERFMHPVEPIARVIERPEKIWFRYLAQMSFCRTEILDTEIVPRLRVKYHKKREEPHMIIHGREKIEIRLPVKRKYITRILEADNPYRVLVDYAKELGMPQESISNILRENLELANKLMKKNEEYVKKIEEKGINRERIAALLTLYFILLDRILD